MVSSFMGVSPIINIYEFRMQIINLSLYIYIFVFFH
jgi:hypothetical protein